MFCHRKSSTEIVYPNFGNTYKWFIFSVNVSLSRVRSYFYFSIKYFLGHFHIFEYLDRVISESPTPPPYFYVQNLE